MPRFGFDVRAAYRLVVWGGFLVMLAANAPGHVSYDSAAQLHEGHFGLRETWGPALYAWLLGLFDSVIPGTALYVAASGLVLFGSLASLPSLRPRAWWTGALAALLAVLTPQLLIYQGIVWKDVLFANLAVAGLVTLAHAAHRWDRRALRWALLALSLLLLACAAQVRQNGVVAAGMAALALGWIASRGSWRRGLAWGAGGLVAAAVAVQLVGALALGALAKNPQLNVGSGVGFGVRILQHYDLVGAAALDPSYPLAIIERADPEHTAVLRARAAAAYSGQRVDLISRDETLSAAIIQIPEAATVAQWRDLVFRHPGLYLKIRLEDFRWVLLTPEITVCLPVHVGVDAPARLLGDLKIAKRFSGADVQLSNYASWSYDTPVMQHAAYAVLALVLAGFLAWRREPADIAFLALELAAAAFTASFLLISIACDYRYLYFTDLAALTGLVYVALDPRRGAR